MKKCLFLLLVAFIQSGFSQPSWTLLPAIQPTLNADIVSSCQMSHMALQQVTVYDKHKIAYSFGCQISPMSGFISILGNSVNDIQTCVQQYTYSPHSMGCGATTGLGSYGPMLFWLYMNSAAYGFSYSNDEFKTIKTLPVSGYFPLGLALTQNYVYLAIQTNSANLMRVRRDSTGFVFLPYAVNIISPSFLNFFDDSTGFLAGSTDSTVLNDVLYQTKDRGATWQMLHTFTTGIAHYHIRKDSSIYMLTKNAELWKSPDLGQSWIYRGKVPNGTPRLVHFAHQSDGYICGDNGYLVSTSDEGTTWNVETSNTASNITGFYSYDDYRYYVTAAGRVGVSKNRPVGIKEFDDLLDQVEVYPNPSGGDVHIDIPRSTFTDSEGTLKIYDMCGALKFQNVVQQGSNSIDLSPLAPGCYAIRILFGNSERKGKLILLDNH